MSRPPAQPKPTPGPKTDPPPKPRPSKAVADEVMYPVAELAALWRCTPQHIYNLIAAKQLTSVQIGLGRAKTRVPASAAAEFVARRASKGRAA